MKLAVGLLLLASVSAIAEERSLRLENGRALTYRTIDAERDSARRAAAQFLGLLAAGDIEAAARLSNAPERRRAVLREYYSAVGEAEFRRIFAEYAAQRVVAEVAIGDRRLLVRDLGDEQHHLAGLYFVQSAAGFLIDDVPGEERSQLARVLAAYRAGRATP